LRRFYFMAWQFAILLRAARASRNGGHFEPFVVSHPSSILRGLMERRYWNTPAASGALKSLSVSIRDICGGFSEGSRRTGQKSRDLVYCFGDRSHSKRTARQRMSRARF
jgi:hypothetical protein